MGEDIKSLTARINDIYKRICTSYIPDTYAKISFYLPLMATMELYVGKSPLETLMNRATISGTDLINGVITGVVSDYAREWLDAEEEGSRQKNVDKAAAITTLVPLYFLYQHIVAWALDRPTDTILPACFNLTIILLATAGKYGRKRNNNRRDYLKAGNTYAGIINMIKNDYYRTKNWMVNNGVEALNVLN